MTLLLSWRVQNFVVISRICHEQKYGEIQFIFHFDRNIVSGTGARAWAGGYVSGILIVMPVYRDGMSSCSWIKPVALDFLCRYWNKCYFELYEYHSTHTRDLFNHYTLKIMFCNGTHSNSNWTNFDHAVAKQFYIPIVWRQYWFEHCLVKSVYLNDINWWD